MHGTATSLHHGTHLLLELLSKLLQGILSVNSSRKGRPGLELLLLRVSVAQLLTADSSRTETCGPDLQSKAPVRLPRSCDQDFFQRPGSQRALVTLKHLLGPTHVSKPGLEAFQLFRTSATLQKHVPCAQVPFRMFCSASATCSTPVIMLRLRLGPL